MYIIINEKCLYMNCNCLSLHKNNNDNITIYSPNIVISITTAETMYLFMQTTPRTIGLSSISCSLPFSCPPFSCSLHVLFMFFSFPFSQNFHSLQKFCNICSLFFPCFPFSFSSCAFKPFLFRTR